MNAVGLSREQLALRRSGIGASEVAKVVGIIPGAIDVWSEKVEGVQAFQGNDLTEFGSRIEKVIADAYAERHPGVTLIEPGTLAHPKFPWALATPDRIASMQGKPDEVIEIKTVFFSGADYGETGTDQVPEKYLIQVAWQLAVTDLETATLVALVNGSYREYPITRDRELENHLLTICERWWHNYVIKGVPPPADGSSQYSDYLRRRYPADMAPPIEPNAEVIDLLDRLRSAKAQLKAAEEVESQASNALRAAIGDAAGILGLCTYKNNKPSTKVEWEGVARNIAAAAGMERSKFDQIVASQTINKPGARVLRLSKEK